MYKSIVLFAFAAIVNMAVATPPACMIAAINQQENIADFGSICGDNASDVQSSIQDVCGDSANDALSAFADACKAKGHEVSIPASSSSKSPSSTPTGSATHTTGKSTIESATGSPSGGTSTPTSDSGAATTVSTVLITPIATPSAPLAPLGGASGSPHTATDSAGNPVQTGAAGHVTVGAGIAGVVVAVVFAAL